MIKAKTLKRCCSSDWWRQAAEAKLLSILAGIQMTGHAQDLMRWSIHYDDKKFGWGNRKCFIGEVKKTQRKNKRDSWCHQRHRGTDELIGVNAAIEAARTSEQDCRIAVVADDEIDEMISHLLSTNNKAVVVIENSQNFAKESVGSWRPLQIMRFCLPLLRWCCYRMKLRHGMCRPCRPPFWCHLLCWHHGWDRLQMRAPNHQLWLWPMSSRHWVLACC